jgi:hypothetical protein
MIAKAFIFNVNFLIPLKVRLSYYIHLIGFGLKLGEVNFWHQLCLHVIHRIFQSIYELIEVFFVQKHLMFFIREPVSLWMTTALCDGKIIIVGSRRANIEEVSPFSCPDPFGVDLLSVFHYV